MSIDVVLKKSFALLAAMLTMAVVWCFIHLPGANLTMVSFAFLSSAALCNIVDFNTKIRLCILMACGAAALQLVIGITAFYPLVRVAVFSLSAFLILSTFPDRQSAVIILLTGTLSIFSQPGISASLNRCIDILFAGVVVLLVTSASNIFCSDSKINVSASNPYSIRQAAVTTAELALGFIISLIFKHEQFIWIILTILFILMAENPYNPTPELVKQRIAATPSGIFAGGLYLACFTANNYQMLYIVPLTGTLGFFILYLKNDYFLFTFLFMFTITLFTDWMTGTGKQFHFTDILVIRSISAITGGVLTLCGANLMKKESVS